MKTLKYILNKLLDVTFYLVLLALLWGVLQVFCFTSFNVPSDSMQPTLVPGDRIVVNKLAGGARLFDLFAALNRKPFNIYRMPGFSSFNRNDVLVFNYPYPDRKDSISFDIMKYYVKRCIGLPGDTVEIRKGYFRVRGVEQALGNMEMQAIVANLPDTIKEMRAFPKSQMLPWTIKEFGPFAVPAKGQVVQMSKENWRLYRFLIFWEQQQRPILQDDVVYLGDSIITEYSFRKDYYFMAGDRLINSQDSRYWGVVPEEYIVGKVAFAW
ncbi:signal peptidase I [Bacteroides sp. 214]|uniref:signal peptidase I n=1 Tax=Bacteroides sp. 214 TaxID=2302935 RepID=UPI0013D72338|nr:signal peptidase I [Bacteroides sp. 214]NDW11628.1 signal peptidase I [Bacteroides sp. 214]